MRKSLVKEVKFGKGIAKVTVTMFTQKKYSDGWDLGMEEVIDTAKVEIVVNGKVVCSSYSAEVLEYERNVRLFKKANLNPTKKYTMVGDKAITEGEESGNLINEAIKEMTAELAKEFNVETEEEKQQKEEIAEAEAVVAQSEKEGIDNLMSNTQIKSWRKQYNDLYNEGGEGYIPSKVSKEAYQKALKILNRNEVIRNG
ncbi:hypothetical protein [Mesobacillus stamsii]|uniref:Uncharacterized protein n=1 Tax=Mesobacillus stamsii TaxID=225347 RepID=A0ABU0FXD5_9BACI|nr:hypothetical protein [Mesobacillus stamsii]MDQ0414569.1 hypothetical protein [Mesobacillus stamsii]